MFGDGVSFSGCKSGNSSDSGSSYTRKYWMVSNIFSGEGPPKSCSQRTGRPQLAAECHHLLKCFPAGQFEEHWSWQKSIVASMEAKSKYRGW
jgi:hypothetical protein